MGLPKIGAVLALDGEREYRSAITSINTAQREMRSEMKLASEAFYGQENSIEALTYKQELLTRQQEAQIQKVELCRAAADKYAQAQEDAGKKVEEAGDLVRYTQERLDRLKNSSDATTDEIQRQEKVVQLANEQLEVANREYENASKKSSEWETSLNNATTELLKTNRTLEENAAYIQEAQNAVDGHAKSIDGFGKAVKEADEQSNDFSETWNEYGRQLVDLQKMEMTVSVLKEVGSAAMDVAKDAAAYADDILTMATNTSVAADTLQELKYAQDLMDVSLETVTSSMARNIRAMNNARKGTADYVDAYEKLGVTVEDVTTGDLRDAETVFWECIDALGQMENETERDAVAMQIFGRSAQDLNSLIAQGSKGFAELAKEARTTGYVLSGETLASLGSMQDAMDRFSNQSTKVKNKIGAELAPTVTKALDDIAEKGDEMVELAVDLGEEILPILSNSISFLIDNAETLIPVMITGAAAIKAYKVASEVAETVDAFRDATKGATLAQSAMNAVANANPYVILATALVAAGTAITAYCVLADDAEDETKVWKKEIEALTEKTREFNETSRENAAERESTRKGMETEAASCRNLVKELESLQAKTSLSTTEQVRQQMVIDELNQAIPGLSLAIDEQTGQLNLSTEALNQNVEAMMALAQVEAAREDLTEIAKEQYEAERNLADLREQLAAQIQVVADAQADYNAKIEEANILHGDQVALGAAEAAALDQARAGQEALEEQIRATEESIAGFTDEYEETMEYISDTEALAKASGAVLEVGNSAESAGEQLNSMSESAIQSFTEMGESIQESVKNQMDIFEEYEKQNEISSDKLIRNMESQVQSVQNWGDNLNELASRADENGLLINEGLLQHLVELGPEGAAYIQAFVEMTDEELKRANELWAESITLPESISERFVKTGESITKGLQKGLSDNTPAVQTAMTNVAASGLDAMNKEFAINSPSKKTQQTGKELIDGLKLGVEENQPVVLSTIQVMSISVVDATRKGLASDIFREIGLQTADGLANGIRAGESNVINAAVEVANAAVAAARSTLGIHSPSKVTEEMGGYYMDGWILGIQARTENLKDAVRGALSTALISETGVADSYGGFSGETEPVAASGNTVYIYFQPQQMTEDEMERAFEYVNTKFGYAL